MSDNISRIKYIINALRIGIIPDVELELFNAGRDEEVAEFKRCLYDVKSGNAIVKFISGEYGSGKTFMLNLIKQLSIKDHFIVSKVEISNGFYLNNMEILYYNLMHNLIMNATDLSGTDFESIFNIWIEKLRSYPNREDASNEIRDVISSLNNYNSSFARAFLTYIKARINNDNDLSNAASSWIKGEKNIPASLKAKFNVKGDIDKENSIDFLKAFIKLLSLIGYSGMVILVDELELIMNTRSDMRKNAYENIRYLIDNIGMGSLSKCMFVFAGTNNFFEDENKGIKTYYALYQRLCSTSLKGNPSSFNYNPRQPIMHLNKLGFNNLQELTRKVTGLYSKAYSWNPKNSIEAIRNWVLVSLKTDNKDTSDINTREYIIKLIEILDSMEQHPEKNIYNSELKMIEKNGVITFANAKLS